MTIGRSRAYSRIHDQVRQQFRPNEEERKDMHPSEAWWAKTLAPKWVACRAASPHRDYIDRSSTDWNRDRMRAALRAASAVNERGEN